MLKELKKNKNVMMRGIKNKKLLQMITICACEIGEAVRYSVLRQSM